MTTPKQLLSFITKHLSKNPLDPKKLNQLSSGSFSDPLKELPDIFCLWLNTRDLTAHEFNYTKNMIKDSGNPSYESFLISLFNEFLSGLTPDVIQAYHEWQNEHLNKVKAEMKAGGKDRFMGKVDRNWLNKFRGEIIPRI